MSKILAPLVHMNGTSRDGLTEPLEAAYGAIEAAYRALKLTAPNGRDYYPLSPGSIDRATNEHRDRLRKLDSLRMEIEALLGAILSAETEVEVVSR